MSNPRVYVAGAGMITPVGANTEMTAAMVRAGVNKYEDSIHYNKDYNPMKMALVPDKALPPLADKLEATKDITARQKRMLRLLTPALEEAMVSYVQKEPIPLFLAGPESLPECPAPNHEKFIDYLMVQTKVDLDRKNSRFFATGRAGGLQAIELAFRYFEATGKDFILIGGVDSYQDHYLLNTLDMEGRVKAEGVMDGFAPGEAAGFLLLASENGLKKLKQKPGTIIFLPGLSDEVGHRYSKEPYKGDGLAESFRLAITYGAGMPIKAIYASLNGENFGVKEYGVATMRNSAAFDSAYKLEHPADSFGDVGAAIGPIMLGLISREKKGNYLAYCSSENQSRAAVSVMVQ